jgi:hypothetical protein
LIALLNNLKHLPTLLFVLGLSSLAFAYEARVNSLGEYWRFDNSHPINYYINLGNQENSAHRDAIILGINQAFDLIDNHPLFSIDFNFQGLTAQLPQTDELNIVYIDTDNSYVLGVGLTFNQNQVDDTATTLSTDIALSGNLGTQNLQSLYFALTLHELLHFLGLDHSTSGSDSAVFANTIHSRLSADDIAGIATLYPNPDNPLINSTATIEGRIINHNQFPVDARIIAYDQDKQNPQPRVVTVRSNIAPHLNNLQRGKYTLSGIPPGNYHLVAESAGHTFIHSYLNDGQTLELSATDEFIDFDLQLPAPPFELLSLLWTRKAVYHQQNRLTYFGYGNKLHAINGFGHTKKRLNQRVDDLVFSADKSELFILDQINDKIIILDVDENSKTYHSVVATISNLPRQPLSIAVNSLNIAFVATHSGKSVAVIDMNNRTIIKTITTGFLCHSLSISNNEKKVYLGGIFESEWRIFEINSNEQSPNYLTISQQQSIGSHRAYIIKTDFNNRYLFVGAKNGLEIRRSHDFSLVKSIDTGFPVISVEPSIDGSALYFLGVDNQELQNTQLWKLSIESLTISEKTTLGYPFSYISTTRNRGKLLFSGKGGLTSAYIDLPEEALFKNSFEIL